MNTIIETIKQHLNNDHLFEVLYPKIISQIENPHPEYGVISPSYSLMSCFFDYYNVDVLSNEQMIEVDRVVKIVDDAFGFGWQKLFNEINKKQEIRANEMISDLKHTKQMIQVLSK